MSKRIAIVPWSAHATGIVLAIVHPGGFLAPALKVHRVAIESIAHLELRVEYARYAEKATGGTAATQKPIADDDSSGSATVLFGDIAGLGSPTFVVPDRISTRGPSVGGHLFASGEFTLASNHTFTVSLLDAVPSSVSYPLTFVVEYDE